MSKDSSGLFPNRLTTNDSQLKHMFGVRPGHLADTQKNRDTISRIANDDSCYKGTDQWGNKWYIESLANGGEHWAEVNKNGIIWDGGYNRTPQSWNSKTGLKSPTKPTAGSKKAKPKIKTLGGKTK